MSNASDDLGISVLIPAHGEGKYLLNAIKSTLDQEYPSNFEILVISQKLHRCIINDIANLKLPNLRIIQDSGFGLVSALNLGLQQSQHSWIARLDSDDLMDPNRIANQIKAVKKHPRASVIGGNAFKINTHGEILGKIRYPHANFAIQFVLKYSCPVPHPGVLMKKEIVLEAGGYSENFAHAEDFELWSRLGNKIKFYNIRKNVLYYRIHDEQVTNMNIESIKSKVSFIIFKNMNPEKIIDTNGIESLSLASHFLRKGNIFAAVIRAPRGYESYVLVFRYVLGKILSKIIILIGI